MQRDTLQLRRQALPELTEPATSSRSADAFRLVITNAPVVFLGRTRQPLQSCRSEWRGAVGDDLTDRRNVAHSALWLQGRLLRNLLGISQPAGRVAVCLTPPAEFGELIEKARARVRLRSISAWINDSDTRLSRASSPEDGPA